MLRDGFFTCVGMRTRIPPRGQLRTYAVGAIARVLARSALFFDLRKKPPVKDAHDGGLAVRLRRAEEWEVKQTKQQITCKPGQTGRHEKRERG